MRLRLKSPPGTAKATEPVVALPRRTIDLALIAIGGLVTLVLLTSGGLLTWGQSFSAGYVRDELTSQNITFPNADALTAEGRADLLEFADKPLTTGSGAQAYASYIDGHLQGIADGVTYSELGTPERAAREALADTIAADAPQADINVLQSTADGVTAQREAMFKGETLRGLLLSAYAWSTVGRIAGIASIAAFRRSRTHVLLRHLRCDSPPTDDACRHRSPSPFEPASVTKSNGVVW